MAGKISEYPSKSTFNDTDLYDCSTTGTTSEKVTYAQLKTDLKNTFHTQGGNSYGATLTIGTNDNNDVAIERNGSNKIVVESAEVQVTDYINIGDGADSANLRVLSFKVAQQNPASVFTAVGSEQLNFLGIASDRVHSYEVMIKGVDGNWYKENHTYTANSLFQSRLIYSATNAIIGVYAAASETNFNNSPIKFTIIYTA